MIGYNHSLVSQYVQHFLLNFGWMVHVVYDQITHICLHHYCTKSQQCFLQTGNLIIDHLHLVEANIYHASVKQALLSNLYEALVSDNKYAVVPGNPRRKIKQKADCEAGSQTAKKPAKPKRGLDCQLV